MKKLVFAACMLASLSVMAQDETVKDLKKSTEKAIKKDAGLDTIQMKWKKGANLGINFNQGSLSNWSAGGDKFSMSLNGIANLFAFMKEGKHSWDNSLDLNYGIVNTTSLGKRKSADRFDLLSKYGYAIKPKLNLAALANLRTQFAPGYSYLKNRNNADSAVLISKGFSPAYVLLSPGLDWKPTSNFSLFFSPITARWVIVSDPTLGSIYGLTAGKKTKSEFGAFASANYIKAFSDRFTYKTKLDLFSNYKQDPQNIDIFWTNMITAKLTKAINFNFQLDMIYDDNIKNVKPGKGPAPQIMQLMGLGFAYNINNYSKK